MRSTTRSATSLAVTGGKGGVGKSNLVLNLAVALGRWGRKVLLVDGDLGLANLDVLLGLMPRTTVEHLLEGEVELDRVLLEGPGGIRLLPAASGVPNLARLRGKERDRLLDSLRRAASSFDDMLIDTGAGLGDASLTMQLAAERVVLITTPEPTSLVDAYATLKILWAADPDKRVDVVANGVVDDAEAERVFEQIARAARQFLGNEPGWLGPVYQDVKVADAVRRQRAVVDLYPDSRAASCYERIAMRLNTQSQGIARDDVDYWERLMVPADEELPN